MKKLTVIIVLLTALIIVLEALPFGAVLNFSYPEEDGNFVSSRQLYSYFDLTPYGYANFGPFITALLSCALLVLSFLSAFLKSRSLRISVAVLSAISLATSLMPLMFGTAYFTAVAVAISALIATVLAISLISYKKSEK